MTILAIDQGGTKTVSLLGDERGHILGAGFAGGACYYTEGLELSLSYIDQSYQIAAESAKIAGAPVELVSAAVSGANWPDEIEMLTNLYRERFKAGAVNVVNDCVGALRGGTDLDNAVVLCAGTGMNAAVLIGGKIETVYNNSIENIDNGGGRLCEHAIEAAIRPARGLGPETNLTERALRHFECESVHELTLEFTRNQLKKRPSTFSYELESAALSHDAAALETLYNFGRSVARYATAAIQKYRLYDLDVVLSGGIFKIKAPVLTDAVSQAVHRVSSSARVVNARFEPVVGAYLLGLESLYGRPLPAEILFRVKEDAEKYKLTRLHI